MLTKEERKKLRKFRKQLRVKEYENRFNYTAKKLKNLYKDLYVLAENEYEKRRTKVSIRLKLRKIRKDNFVYFLRMVKIRTKKLLKFMGYIQFHLKQVHSSIKFDMRQYHNSRRKARKEIRKYLKTHGETLFDYWSRYTLIGQRRPIKKAIRWTREHVIMKFKKCQWEYDDIDCPRCNEKAEVFLTDENGKKMGYFCYSHYQGIAQAIWESEHDV